MALLPKPTIVLVPGSFALRQMYTPFLEHLEFYGYETVYASIPSIGRGAGETPARMQDDALHIQQLCHKLFEAGQSVVLVAHSYGGIPATQSLQGLSAKELGPYKPAVKHIVYASAIIPPLGSSLHSMIGEHPRGAVEISDDGYLTLVGKAASGERDFSLLPEDERLEWAKCQSVHSAASFNGPLTHPGYLDVPVTYMLATQDKSLPPAVQRDCAQMMQDAGADVTITEIETDHCWSASRPKSTALKVVQIIEAKGLSE